MLNEMLSGIGSALDMPRQAITNLGRGAYRFGTGQGSLEDLLGMVPGALGAATAAPLIATGIGAPLGIAAGSAVSGLAQGLGKLGGSSAFDAPSSSDILKEVGGDPESTWQNMALDAATNPLTYAGLGEAPAAGAAAMKYGPGMLGSAARGVEGAAGLARSGIGAVTSPIKGALGAGMERLGMGGLGQRLGLGAAEAGTASNPAIEARLNRMLGRTPAEPGAASEALDAFEKSPLMQAGVDASPPSPLDAARLGPQTLLSPGHGQEVGDVTGQLAARGHTIKQELAKQAGAAGPVFPSKPPLTPSSGAGGLSDLLSSTGREGAESSGINMEQLLGAAAGDAGKAEPGLDTLRNMSDSEAAKLPPSLGESLSGNVDLGELRKAAAEPPGMPPVSPWKQKFDELLPAYGEKNAKAMADAHFPEGPHAAEMPGPMAKVSPLDEPGPQKWQPTGTEFTDHGRDLHTFQGSDGKTYSLTRRMYEDGGLRIGVKDEAGNEVAQTIWKKNPDGTYASSYTKNEAGPKGVGRAMYDYLHTLGGDIVPSTILGKTDEGKAFWAKNALKSMLSQGGAP